jgi:hypothetical protein
VSNISRTIVAKTSPIVAASAIAAALLLGTNRASADVFTFTAATSDLWNDPTNWLQEGAATTNLPSLTDNVDLDGNTVSIANYNAQMNQFASGSGGTVNIDNGGILTAGHQYVTRYVSTINVNDGGQFPMATTWLVRTNVNVNEGGTATGAAGIPQAEGKTFAVNGTFSPRGTTLLASGTSFNVGASSNAAYWGKFLLGSTGTVILDLFGNDSNEFFNVAGITTATELKIDTGTIELRPQEGYVPQIGDFFDLWDVTDPDPVMNIGDGSNIVLPGYTLDLTQWTSDGIVTVSGATGVPEPASLSLLALGTLALLHRRRR